ncbi:hypothetical protein HYS54_05250 [Candidatus Micrarchaeota archaeon]|nr:hypothetical protein [Candidatus Micrarchaeota archaeon]
MQRFRFPVKVFPRVMRNPGLRWQTAEVVLDESIRSPAATELQEAALRLQEGKWKVARGALERALPKMNATERTAFLAAFRQAYGLQEARFVLLARARSRAVNRVLGEMARGRGSVVPIRLIEFASFWSSLEPRERGRVMGALVQEQRLERSLGVHVGGGRGGAEE